MQTKFEGHFVLLLFGSYKAKHDPTHTHIYILCFC